MNALTLTNTAWSTNEHAFPGKGTMDEKLRFLLNYAILAPSLQNTQPWKFAVRGDEIRVLADTLRWMPVTDPDQRELYISVGCALTNLLVAATHFGFRYEVHYFPQDDDKLWVATVKFIDQNHSMTLADRELFYAIPQRHTNRQVYLNKAVSERDLQEIRNAVDDPNVSLFLTDSIEVKRRVDQLQVQADFTQFADPHYRDELAYWMNQGALNPSWLISRVGQMAVTYLNMGSTMIQKDAELLASAPLVGVLSTAENGHYHQVKAGEVFEHIALAGTGLRMGIQPMSQLLQVPALKAEVSALTSTPELEPQFIFRIGYAEPAAGYTPRQQLESVLA